MDPGTQSLPPRAGAPEAPEAGPDADLTGRTLGDFRVLRRLGQGGMGQVYLAEQLSLKRQVALKIMRADLAANAAALQRFKQEAEAVARATHANIVQVYFIGEAAGLHYMALEYVEGRNLREYVEKKGPPEVLVGLSIMRQVASALQRASELGIIHRDIKPENILLTRKGEAKVADFGLSRVFGEDRQPLHLTQSGVTMGTPLYMSPEQVEGRPVDPRTDIYSFGVTCYFMLAGHPPYQGQNPFEVALQHVQGTPRPLAEIRPDLPPGLCAVVHKMMARQPEQRYQTGREIVRDVGQLRDAIVGVGSGQATAMLFTGVLPAVPASPTGLVPVRRRRWLRWAAGASVLLALGAGAAFAWLRAPSGSGPADGDGPVAAAGRAEPPALSSRSREPLLLAELARYANPGDDPDRVRWGLRCGAELGLLYLDDWRLDEAERFFKDMDGPNKVPAYRTLGQLGLAVVHAFKDRPTHSLLLFEKVVGANKKVGGGARFLDKDRLGFYELVYANRQFRRMIARALEHNCANTKKPLPTNLERLRQPPGSFPAPRKAR